LPRAIRAYLFAKRLYIRIKTVQGVDDMNETIWILVLLVVALIVTAVIVAKKKNTVRRAPPPMHKNPSVDETVDWLPEVTEMSTQDIPAGHYTKHRMPGYLKDALQQTVIAAQPVLQDAKSYKIKFGKEALRDLKKGSATLVKRKDGKGYLPSLQSTSTSSFKHQAAIIKKVDPKVVLNASVNLLAAAVGQQQMAEMQSSLDRIENKANTLLEYVNDEYLGRAQARIHYTNTLAKRFVKRGILIDGAEDSQIENIYKETIEDIFILHNQQKTIVKEIEDIKESEKIRGLKTAKYQKNLFAGFEEFKNKQEIIELNYKFLKEYYEPYMKKIRNVDDLQIEAESLKKVQAMNSGLIKRIDAKLDSLQTNYKVWLGINKQQYIENSVTQAKELMPSPLTYEKPFDSDLPEEIIVGVDEDGGLYAYLLDE